MAPRVKTITAFKENGPYNSSNLRELAYRLDLRLNPGKTGPAREVGFVLITFPPGSDEGVFISNCIRAKVELKTVGKIGMLDDEGNH